jgi:hypothetical protein
VEVETGVVTQTVLTRRTPPTYKLPDYSKITCGGRGLSGTIPAALFPPSYHVIKHKVHATMTQVAHMIFDLKYRTRDFSPCL